MRIDRGRIPKIDKGVPMTQNKTGYWTETIKAMEVMDSVVLESPQDANCLWVAAKRLNRKVTVRQTPDKKQLRVWRIA